MANPAPDWWTSGNEARPLRWNRALPDAFDKPEPPKFDIAAQRFSPASVEQSMVSRYLQTEVKLLERRAAQVISVRMGAYLTAIDDELRAWRIDDVRNLNWRGEEEPPSYDTIQLNSTRAGDFLIDGMRFLSRDDAGLARRATLRIEPRWWGLELSAYGLRGTGEAGDLLARLAAGAAGYNFLKGEAFSLSGEFLPVTDETWDDLFLDTTNASAMQRVVRLVNERGAALESRGVLLMGPPGTGKTLSARIARNLAQATFIWVSARDFHYAGSFGGFTQAFDLARECAPSVLVFEDVDNWLYDTTTDLLKTEMDGVAKRSGVVTMMTTNYPELLPAALLDRPGRFHDVLKFDLPDAAARTLMLRRWLPGLADDVQARALAATAGFSGAHVRELARFAGIIAEQDGLALGPAVDAAIRKLKDQRDLIAATQRRRSLFQPPPELVARCGVRGLALHCKGATGMETARAHATFHVRSLSDERREFAGVATTPTPDRLGDVIEPLGVNYQNPLPLLLYHDATKPVGQVLFDPPTADGVTFRASIPRVAEPGALHDRVEEAWQSVKSLILRTVSIGFRAVPDMAERMKTGGIRFKESEVVELSLVAVPANPDAMITAFRTLPHTEAAHGQHVAADTPGASGTRQRQAPRGATTMRIPLTDQIRSLEATRAASAGQMSALMDTSGEAGSTLDAQQQETFDGLEAEVRSIDQHLTRLRTMEDINRSAAQPAAGPAAPRVPGATPAPFPVVQVRSNEAPGVGLARAVLCRVASFLDQGVNTPVDIAKQRYPHQPEIAEYLRASVNAGTSVDATWAGPLVYATNLVSEFIDFVRPLTLIGKFGTTVNGVTIPSLRRLPFNIRIPSQTTGGAGYWVGEGAPKPLTSFAFDAVTLPYTKAAAISIITRELARFSSPSAEMLVRDGLAKAIIDRLDTDFVDPAKAVSSGVNPASITNGLTALSSAGTSADNARTDIQNLLNRFILANLDPTTLVIIMPNSLALALSVLVNSLGQPEFPGMSMMGGRLLGIPVIASQYAASSATYGNMVIAVKADDVGLADDGEVTVDMSTEASLQMLDNPTNNSASATATTMVSMFQTNSIALRAERFIHWKKLRSTAVVFMDDVNWGAVGSPV